jgi:hypothetical protein
MYSKSGKLGGTYGLLLLGMCLLVSLGQPDAHCRRVGKEAFGFGEFHCGRADAVEGLLIDPDQ